MRWGTRSGLRHNFRGSAGVTKAQLADRTYTQAHGLGVSVMDYSPAALSLDPRQAGRLLRALQSAPTTAGRSAMATPPLGRCELAATNGKGLRGTRSGLGRPTRRSSSAGRLRPKRQTPLTSTAPTRTPGLGGWGSTPPFPATIRPTIRWSWARERVALINGLFDSLPPAWWRRARATPGCGRHSAIC